MVVPHDGDALDQCGPDGTRRKLTPDVLDRTYARLSPRTEPEPPRSAARPTHLTGQMFVYPALHGAFFRDPIETGPSTKHVDKRPYAVSYIEQMVWA